MGILSKIFKPFKKIIRKVGKAIKGVAKIIAKPLKAVLKPIGKIFGKLGPIGTIALGFILPGLGGALGSWFNAAGGAFQRLFAPGSFMHNAIGSIGQAIQGAAKFGGNVYNKTIGRVFNIGFKDTDDSFHKFGVRDFAVFTKQLDSDAATTLYNSGNFMDVRRAGINGLGVYYPFNKNVKDIVGGHNLTLTGGTFTAL